MAIVPGAQARGVQLADCMRRDASSCCTGKERICGDSFGPSKRHAAHVAEIVSDTLLHATFPVLCWLSEGTPARYRGCFDSDIALPGAMERALRSGRPPRLADFCY